MAAPIDGNLHRNPSDVDFACAAAGRRGAPLLSGGGVGVEWCSGGEGVEQEGACALLYQNGRCTMHSVWRGRKMGRQVGIGGEGRWRCSPVPLSTRWRDARVGSDQERETEARRDC
jgi:hypothetical protein